MKFHKSNIANNDSIEVVQVSADNNDKAAKKWAKKEKFPFAVVMPSDKGNCGLQKYSIGGVPHYVLIDKSGKVLASGYHNVTQKIKTL